MALLSPQQRRAFVRIQLWVVAAAALEVVGVMSIAPLMASLGDEDALTSGDGTLAAVYGALGDPGVDRFRIWFACAVVVVTALGTLLSSVALWRLASFSEHVGATLASRLFTHYIERDWMFHVRHNSAELIQRIAIESLRVTAGVVRPLMQANARGLVAVLILIGMFAYDPVVSAGCLVFFASMYVALYATVRVRTHRNGRQISELSTRRFQVMDESIGGIRELKLRGSHELNVSRFEAGSFGMGRARAENEALAQLPRYVMELSAVVAMVALLLYLSVVEGRPISAVLPTLALFGVASLKLNPALNQVYGAVVTIGGHRAALGSVLDDGRHTAPTPSAPDQVGDPIRLRREIRLKDVWLSYAPESDAIREPVLKGLDLTVRAGTVVGIAGASGAGKSTVMDVIIGLIRADAGEVLVDETAITPETTRRWQASITCVPQTVFLIDATIAENIAFGTARGEIDQHRLEDAIRIAALDELVGTLADGIDTVVGQSGLRLSGGQRQRIGIARALYRHDADLIVLDEATSALDVTTERLVLERIRSARPFQTVLMVTHRLWTLEVCDVVHIIEAGRIAQSGAYGELVRVSPEFRLLSEAR